MAKSRRKKVSDKKLREMQADYEAGLITISAIARKHKVSEGTVRYYAKQYGWKRDMAPEIRRRAQQKLLADQREAQQFTEEEAEHVIEENAERLAGILRKQRNNIENSQALVMRLVEELREYSDITIPKEIYDQLSEYDKKLIIKINAAMSLESRSKIAQNLVTALEKLLNLERVAYGMNDKEPPKDFVPLEERIKQWKPDPLPPPGGKIVDIEKHRKKAINGE